MGVASASGCRRPFGLAGPPGPPFDGDRPEERGRLGWDQAALDRGGVERTAGKGQAAPERQEEAAHRESEPEFHTSTLFLGHEELLKAAPLAVALWLALSGEAFAATLVTGAVRDAQGLAIAGAGVTGVDARGAPLGRTTTDTDGTFALDAAATPAGVRIECSYCSPAFVSVTPGDPVIAIVNRFTALLAAGPTARDLAALPYARLEDALALRPFEVLRPQGAISAMLYPALSDRGLARSALVLDGDAPTYNLGSTATVLGMVPGHGGNAAVFTPPSGAYRYGVYATGGTIALGRDDAGELPLNEEQISEGGARSARVSAGSSHAGFSLGSDADDGTQRARLIASGRGEFFGGTFSAALSASRAESSVPNVRLDERSATLAYGRTFERVRLQFSAADAAGSGAVAAVPSLGGLWNDSILRAGASVRAGRLALEAGAAHINATAQQPVEGVRYDQDTIFFAAHLPGTTRIDAAVGRTFLHVYDGAQRTVTLPSLLVTQQLGSFEVVGGLSQSLLGTSATAPFALASLAEAHLGYGDRRRLRGEVQIYRRASEGLPPLAGSGASLTYQITPTTSVRAWSLRVFGDTRDGTPTVTFAEPYLAGESLWVTHENGGVRIDAIYRRTAAATTLRRAFDADLYLAVGTRVQLGFRSELRPAGRLTSIVMSFRP